MSKPGVFEVDVVLGIMGGMRTSAPQVAVAEKPGKFWLGLLGECVVDKLPQTPNRTDAGGWCARVVSAAVAAGRLAARDERSIPVSAATAGLSALIATKLMYELRKAIGSVAHIPDPVVALAEDAATVMSVIRVRDARAAAFGR